MQGIRYLKFIVLLWIGCALFLILSFLITYQNKKQTFMDKKKIVIRYGLTDYCLSTEAQHTRHISMPTVFSPFQDLPGYHEHFPSSSFFRKELK